MYREIEPEITRYLNLNVNPPRSCRQLVSVCRHGEGILEMLRVQIGVHTV
jgi:hypothetical protein